MMEGAEVAAILKNQLPNVFYHGVHVNSRLDFSDAPVSRDLALTSWNNFGEWKFIAD
jgi:hypothetical protein